MSERVSPGQRLADLGYAAGWRLVRGLPEPLARAAFRAGADLATRRGRAGVAQLRRNYARVVPQAGPGELDELVRDGVRSYARYWMETFRLPGMDRHAVFERVDETVVGWPLIQAALDRGKGLVVALPHTGNYDVSGIWLATRAGGFTTVAERLRPESLYQRFLEYRESLGFEILPASGEDVGPYRLLMERLRQNRIVCLPADRDLSRRGIPVTFFGARTRMPAGPARLAAVTGAQLLIVDNAFTDDGWGLRFHTPITVHGRDDIAPATQRMADAFAADIAAHPADWHMMQKLWIEDLSEQRQQSLAGEVTEST
ncbi:phosphatidylinositol mannoside acyltransferase [Actinophytocola xinjiangensis]|jgi:lauroyl/myristoyl acyltransferase|uniref:Phosphatidylinositol mannoside acyltransferase n=1 Tax=Actinophytocola xinjiangensis TaxID=485602 RepID=A0A7Z0WRZ0_9PSEU|nr:phosphatidylinositol mannoside acyltransferase [Actinophytocola xinjiangensis]OLF13652.1 phosphatidylinositol mannoside acyltransferase [Actinophytocola xinjiangensis]